MSAIDKAKFKASIELFYKNNKSKIKTYNEFKNFKSNGCPIFSKREGLIRRIKKCVAEIDMTMVIKMFQNLKPKIIQANINGLDSLL